MVYSGVLLVEYLGATELDPEISLSPVQRGERKERGKGKGGQHRTGERRVRQAGEVRGRMGRKAKGGAGKDYNRSLRNKMRFTFRQGL